MKINSLSISGLRGVRHELFVPLNGKSALLYGDNGSGKSTVSDVLEWFFCDRIDHLIPEIGRKGYEGLRNILLDDNTPGSLSLKFTNSDYNCEKTIEAKKDNLKTKLTNNSKDFTAYLSASQDENLILRYKDLVTFILSSKSEKLGALSEIIGYSKVTDTRDVLRTVYNRLSKEIKSKGFDNLINHQNSQIIEQFEQNITSDEQFVEVVKELVKPFKLNMKIESLKDINEVLAKIKKPDDSKEVKQETLLQKIEESLVNLPANLDELEKQYKNYKKQFDAIVSDIHKLKKLTIEKLLTAGKELLSSESYKENNCPLCLKEQNKEELLSKIKSRIAELVEIKKEQKELTESNAALQQQITETTRQLHALLDDKQIDENGNASHKTNIDATVKAIKKYHGPLKIEVVSENNLEDENTLLIDRNVIDNLQKDCKTQLEVIRAARKKDPKWDASGKIMISSHAYAQIRRLKKEKASYEKQRDTMETIYRRFLKKQKEALGAFLDTYSDKINEIYQFLNPGERVENIKLIPIEKDDELSGITIQFDYMESKGVTPPHKLLSESHINCLGIAFFLTSVDAFNKQNKFIILDDLISSFDSKHRKRFADLLFEKYDDYQIILLTHEKTWFDIVKNLVQNKGWNIKTIKHNEDKGTHLEEAPQTLKERIEQNIADGNASGLGNDARKYLENILKQIALALDVKVPYRFNDANEDRMAFELLTELKGTINKRKSTELKSEPVIDRLLGSLFIGNKDSHNSSFEPTFGDIKAFWQDVTDFEKIFFCATCGSPVSLRYYDEGAKQVSCKKGEISYTWKVS